MPSDLQVRKPSTAPVGRRPLKFEDSSGPLGARELIIAWGSLALLGALVYLPHLLHGGLYMDDWSDAAAALYPPGGGGLGGAISFFNELLSSCRPVLILFLPLKYIVLGPDVKLLLGLAIGLAIVVACLAYAVLRYLRVPWYHAGVLAGLTLVYPWFDSTRFWESASPISLAVAFGLGGLWLALVGLQRRYWLHVCASLLYLCSMLTYELTLPLIACAGVIYVARVGWRKARGRWALDLLMVLIAGLWSTTHTPRTASTIADDIDHAKEITTSGGELLGRTLFSLGPHPQTTICLLALGIIGAAGVWRLLSTRSGAPEPGWTLRNWAVLFVSGLIVAALGWVTFVPADSYYTPTIYGVTNRVNGVAGFGLILTVYAAFGIVGSLIADRFDRRHALAVAVPLVLGFALGLTYVRVLERHSDIWRDAYRSEVAASTMIEKRFPSLPPRTTLFANGYPAWQTLGVPIFASTWGLSGRVQLLYGDSTLRAFPITEELTPVCTPAGIKLKDQPLPAVPYGTARLLDLSSGRSTTPHNLGDCHAQVPEFPPAPAYVSTAY